MIKCVVSLNRLVKTRSLKNLSHRLFIDVFQYKLFSENITYQQWFFLLETGKISLFWNLFVVVLFWSASSKLPFHINTQIRKKEQNSKTIPRNTKNSPNENITKTKWNALKWIETNLFTMDSLFGSWRTVINEC